MNIVRELCGGLVFAVVLTLSACDQSGKPTGDVCPAAGDQAVTDALKPIRQKYHVPAIAGAIVTSKGLDICGVVGVRKSGTDIPVTLNDKWHLGSDTKAMTATLVGRLVEDGSLKWDTTVADVFPDLAAKFHPEMKGVTVGQLLSHRAGLPANPDVSSMLWYKFAARRTLQQERLQVVSQALAKKPEYSPGSKFQYSNLGYVIVGAIIEKVTGMSWEDAIKERIFQPLAMKSVGFGGTGTSGQIDQPWPHKDGAQPVDANGPSMDNPPIIGPAGRVHCTIQDWGKFVTDQLRGERGEPALLKNSTYKVLHTPHFGGEYAFGWIAVERDWGGGIVLNHLGDNTMNCANVWIAPQRDFAVLICINQGGATAWKASRAAVEAMIKLHASEIQAAENQ
jgi:CubicO group peptidase (beta-lactamase class C family)